MLPINSDGRRSTCSASTPPHLAIDDVMGLLLVIQGGGLVALTKDAVTIRRTSESVLTFCRRDTSDAVVVLEMTR
jgi:hypothetical protein